MLINMARKDLCSKVTAAHHSGRDQGEDHTHAKAIASFIIPYVSRAAVKLQAMA